MKIPGKVVDLRIEQGTDGHWPMLYTLTDEGKIFAAPVNVPIDQLEWSEVSRNLKDDHND